jgi:ZIP family zinc transporter
MIHSFLESFSPAQQAALGGLATWLLTFLGALPVLFLRRVNRSLMDGMMGGAAGIMVAAACWSLLVPALEAGGVWRSLLGLGFGAIAIWGLDRVIPHLHPEFPDEAATEGPSVAWKRTRLLIAAITIHNLPEGLAVGLGFGRGDLGRAIVLALGIGIQNIPEGLAIALPLRRDGMSRGKALWYGQLSAVIEPVAAVAGALFVGLGAQALPYGLAFAAGAMLYVVVEELLPETTRSGNVDVATVGFILGFGIMMALDQLAS